MITGIVSNLMCVCSIKTAFDIQRTIKDVIYAISIEYPDGVAKVTKLNNAQMQSIKRSIKAGTPLGDYWNFGSNMFTFRDKLQMLVFLDKYYRHLCKDQLLKEIQTNKLKNSLHFI